MAEAERRLNAIPPDAADFTPERPDWFPTMEFVARLNASPARRGKPYLGALDGLTLMLWHFEREALKVRPQDMIQITGC